MRLVSQFFRQLAVYGCAASVSLALLVVADQAFDAGFVSTATAQDAVLFFWNNIILPLLITSSRVLVAFV